MASLPDQIKLPKPTNEWQKLLVKTLTEYLNTNSQLVNGLSKGALAARINASSAVPTGGHYAKGDTVLKQYPSAISAGTSYLHLGWVCVSEGSASAASFSQYIVISDGSAGVTLADMLGLENGSTIITEDSNDIRLELP